MHRLTALLSGLLVLSLWCCSTCAQTTRPDPSLLRTADAPHAWLTVALGAGHGLGEGLNSSVGASLSAAIPATRLAGQLGLNLNASTDLEADVPDPYGVSVHLGVGPSKQWDQAGLAFLIGPAYAWGRRFASGRAYQAASLHTSVQFFLVPVAGLGFGLDVFHAWNAIERTSGFRLAVQVGKM